MSGSVTFFKGVSNLARFFVQANQIKNGTVVIVGDDAHHITRVLRLQPGSLVECVDQDEQVHQVELQELGTVVVGSVQQTLGLSQESPLHLTLFQGLAKGDKMDLVIQKAVELGVHEIIPFTSRYTVVKLTEKQATTRHERWERIAHEAAKQCGRTRLPVIHQLHSFAQVLTSIQTRRSGGELVLLAYEGEKHQGLKQVDAHHPTAVSVLIGPEGGFSSEEVADLAQVGAHTCSLGPRILRTETAGLVALSLLGYKWGDLG